MKSLSKQIWLLLLLFMLGMVWNETTANADYKISDFKVNVNINKDGSADVNRSMTYKFGDDYHGIYFVQDLRGTDGADLKKITVSNNGGAIRTIPVNNSEQNLTAKMNLNSDQMKLKLFNTVSSGDEAKVSYNYKINGVVTSYRDTAELNWKVIGSEWDVPLENAQVVINLPGTNVKKLQAWSHGAANGYTTVNRKNGKIIIDVGDNPENSFVESHMVFPTSLVPDNKKIVNEDKLKDIQNQEDLLVQQENQAKERTRKMVDYAKIFVSIFSGIIILIMMAWLLRRGYHPYTIPAPIEHSFDVPTVAPAVAQAILNKKQADSDAISAEILKLASEGQLNLKQVQYGKRNKDTTEISRLKDFDMSFINQCIDEIGDGQKVTIQQINNFTKKDRKGRVAKWYRAWQKEIDHTVSQYKDDHNVTYRNGLIGLAIITPILAMIMGGLGLAGTSSILYGVIGLIVTIGIESWIAITWPRVSLYNDEGLEQFNQIRGFKQMLKDIAHFNTAKIGDLILWEEILPYATAFKLSDRVADQLRTDFSADDLEGNVILYPYYFGINGANFGLASGLGAAISHSVSASSGGSSGGFTGGSSGGFGGGSGGGAF